MPNHKSIRKLWFVMPLFIIAFVFLFIIPSTVISIISKNSDFGTTNLAYGQLDQMNSNVTKSLNIQNIPVKKVHVGDIDIAYKMFGKGDPILLVSGAGGDMNNSWLPSTLRNLSSNHTVIVFDNRGIGNTTTGVKPFSIQLLASDTAGLLDALKIQKADVLGYSLGSFVAQQLTVSYPDKVNRLILVAASCGGKEGIPQSPQLVKMGIDLRNKIVNHIPVTPQEVKTILSMSLGSGWIKLHPNYLETIPKAEDLFAGIPPNTQMQQLNAILNWEATNSTGVCSQLPNISKPTLVITGTSDVVVPSANSLIIAAKIPGAWLVQIKDAGHSLMSQYPDKFNKVLQTFLSTTTTNLGWYVCYLAYYYNDYIFDCSIRAAATSSISSTTPQNQNHYYNEYHAGILEIANSLLKILTNQIVDNTMVAAVKGNEDKIILPCTAYSAKVLCTKLTYRTRDIDSNSKI